MLFYCFPWQFMIFSEPQNSCSPPGTIWLDAGPTEPLLTKLSERPEPVLQVQLHHWGLRQVSQHHYSYTIALHTITRHAANLELCLRNHLSCRFILFNSFLNGPALVRWLVVIQKHAVEPQAIRNSPANVNTFSLWRSNEGIIIDIPNQ